MAEDTEGGAETGQAKDYVSDLTAAFDALEQEADPGHEQEAADGADGTPAPEELEASGDEAEIETVDEEPTEAIDDGQEPDGTEETVAVEAPEHWSDADKTSFSELPAEAQPLYLEKVKSLEVGYDRKFEELAEQRKGVEHLREFEGIFEPFRDDLAASGITSAQYTRQLVATALQMRQDPEATIKSLATQYGVDLVGKPEPGVDTPEVEDEFEDPEIRALRKSHKTENDALSEEIRQLSSKIDQSQQVTQQATNEQVNQAWHGFVNAKDAEGKELHPGAAGLLDLIAAKLQASPRQQYETPSAALERAYDAVKFTDPTVMQSMIDAKIAEATKPNGDALEAEKKKAEAEVKRKEELAKAKGAGRTIASKSTKVAETIEPGKSWKEELERQFEAAESAA